jgi:hypothetical protein
MELFELKRKIFDPKNLPEIELITEDWYTFVRVPFRKGYIDCHHANSKRPPFMADLNHPEEVWGYFRLGGESSWAIEWDFTEEFKHILSSSANRMTYDADEFWDRHLIKYTATPNKNYIYGTNY